MDKIKVAVATAAGAVLGAALVVGLPKSGVAPAQGQRARVAIGGGTVSASCNLSPYAIEMRPDGSVAIKVDREINGGHRTKVNGVSADGASFSVDGVPVANPPAAMVALGSALGVLNTRFNAAYSTPAMQTLFCGP